MFVRGVYFICGGWIYTLEQCAQHRKRQQGPGSQNLQMNRHS